MFPVSVAAYVVAAILVTAVAERVRAPGALPAALAAHRVLPAAAIRVTALAVTVAEAALGVAMIAGLVFGPAPLVPAAAALLFAGYGAYSWHVTRAGRGGPCGCGGTEVPMGPWVTVRALVLAALAAGTAVAADTVIPLIPLSHVDERLVIVLLAAGTFATLLWHLPAATRSPEVAR